MVESVPWNSPPMYWRGEAPPPREAGRGPAPVGLRGSPLPLAPPHRLAPPRARTDVGYQPVGMNPSGELPPTSSTLTTATSLVLALATNRTFSSGESASELGVLPDGALGSIAVPIVSTALPASVSKTVTVFRL